MEYPDTEVQESLKALRTFEAADQEWQDAVVFLLEHLIEQVPERSSKVNIDGT